MNPSIPIRRPTLRARPRFALSLLGALALALGGAAPAHAQTWTGGGVTNFWSDALNWQGSVLPASSATTVITFAGTRRTDTLQSLGSPFTLNTLQVASGAGAFSVSGSPLRFAGSSSSLVNNASTVLTLAAPVQIVEQLVVSGNGSVAIKGALSSANADPAFRARLIKRGTGRLSVTEATTFNGLVSVEAGVLRLENALALQSVDVALAVDNGLDVSPLGTVTIGGLSGSGALALGSTQLTVGGSGSSPGMYSGRITAGTGSITKVGRGTLELGGTASNAALLRVNEGTVVMSGGSMALTDSADPLRVGTTAAAPSGVAGVLELRAGTRLSAPGTTAQVDGAGAPTLRVVGTGSRLDTGFQLLVGNIGNGTLVASSGGQIVANTYLAMGFNDGSDGRLEVLAGGTVTSTVGLLGVRTGAQGTALVSGTGARWENIVLRMGGFDPNLRGGRGTLKVENGGIVTATSELAFWSADSLLTVAGGELRVGQLLSQGAVGRLDLLADGANGVALVIDHAGGPASFSGVISGPGTLRKSGTGTQVLAGDNRLTGRVQVTGGVLEMSNSRASEYEVGNGAQLRLGEPALGAAAVRALPGGTVVYTGPALSGGLLMGAGQHDVSAVSRLVGTQVANGAELRPRDGATLVGVVNSGRVVNVVGQTLGWVGGSNLVGTLQVAGRTDVSAFSSGGAIQVAPGGTLANADADLLLGGGSRTFIGSATGPGGRLIAGAGTRVQLNGGLLVNNGVLDGALSVNFGGLAKGAGVFGDVIVTDGGRFSPGNSPGTAHTASATWGAGGGYLVELASAAGTAGIDWDLWRVDGLLDITAGSTSNSRFTLSVQTLDTAGAAGPLAGFDPQRAWQWLIVDTDGGIRGFDPARVSLDTTGFGSSLDGGSFSLVMHDGDLVLQFAPVPEPGTLAQLTAGLLGLGWLARRRRSGWAGRA